MRKDVLSKSIKRFLKTRKEDRNAFFTISLRIRKFEISCSVKLHVKDIIRPQFYLTY